MAAINSHRQSFFPETYAWTIHHAKPPKNVGGMDYDSKESWNIFRDQEKRSLQILWPIFFHAVKYISFFLSEFFLFPK